jgi:hypothetical protein
MKVDEEGWPDLKIGVKKEDTDKTGKPLVTATLPPAPEITETTDWPEVKIAEDADKPITIEEDEETVGSKEDEPFWHPFVRQAVGLGINSYSRIRPADRILKRTTVKTAEDLYNTVNEVIPLGTEVHWEQAYLGKPESVVEDVSSNILSWLTSFAVPGGLVATGAKVVTTIPKVAKTGKAVEKFIEGGELGRKALKGTKIAAEGFLKGAVADYIRTDVDDLEAEEAIAKRLYETYEGGVYGSLLNLTTAGVGRIVKINMDKIRALKKVQKASKGKADPKQAVEELNDVIKEENKFRKELEAA